jgi:predicted DsbA family dithiol-disulfide isomerase
VLTSLAAELGLNSESLRDALGSRQLAKGVLDDEREAEALAVRGVPAFFASQKAALTGVQSVGNLKKLIEHVRELNG